MARANPKVFFAISVTSLVLSVAALGLTIWIASAPRHWFADAYAQRASKATPGRAGGPVGPDAASAIDDVSARLDDLETGTGDQASSSVEDLSSSIDDLGTIDDLETGSGDDAGTSVSDVSDKVNAICDEFSGYSGAFSDIYLAAC